MPKRLHLLFLLLCLSLLSQAQTLKSGILKGKLFNSATHEAFHDVRVTIPDLNSYTSSDGDGVFNISEVPYGTHMVVIGGGEAQRDTFTVSISKDLTDMGDIQLKPIDKSATDPKLDEIEIPAVVFDDNDGGENGGSAATESASNIYGYNKDPFLFNATTAFGQYRFRPRGVNSTDVLINGISVQDQETGFTSLAQVGGLNDVFRDRVVTYGLKPSEYAFGGANGSTYIHASAADQRKGTEISYYLSNRTFRNRIMLTHNSGVSKKGWAYSLSGSRRWSEEGYYPGTMYDGYSVYGAVSKVTKKGQLNLTGFVSPTKYGRTTGATDEVFSLAHDHFYNPDWGYQNGVKRNANISNVSQPTFILNYVYKPNDKTRWNTAFGYEFGKSKLSGLDFYNAYDPYPNYYRNLPSYYLNLNPPEPGVAQQVANQFATNPGQLQINWNELYQSNYINHETIYNVNGIAGNNVSGRRSLYVVSDKVDNMNKFSFNTNFDHVKNEHVTYFGGLSFVAQTDEYYKQLTDLLGGDFYVNYNQFAIQQSLANPNYIYNDLNHPNQVVKVGDKYDYDYKEMVKTGRAWVQGAFSYNKLDMFAAAEAGYTGFDRDGLMRNGLFPDNSYGKSATQDFFTYKVKAGLTYKVDSRNFFFIDGYLSTDAPTVKNTYISVATRDFTVDNPVVSKTQSMEIGYLLKSPKFSARIVGYATDVSDATIIKRFFNDDPSILTYVNYVMRDVNIRSIGTELSGEYRINRAWSIIGVASMGQTYYANTPTVTIYQDNDPTLKATPRNVYIKNYYIAAGPQSVYSASARYRARNYWSGEIKFNYIDRNYVDINPDRHTEEAVDLVQKNSAQWNQIVAQEKLPSAFTVDIFVSKSVELSKYIKSLGRRYILSVNVGALNALNNTDIKIFGYEQLRYDYTYRNPNKFPNVYEYGYGLNYYATIKLKF